MNKQLTYLLIVFALVLSYIPAHGQNADFLAAYKFAQETQVDSAKARIDKCMKDPLVQKDHVVWYVRGFIYKDYYRLKESDNKLSPARAEAVNSFKKAMELDANNEHLKDNKENLKFLATRYYNDAAQMLDTVNYKSSITNFEQYRSIMSLIEPTMSTKDNEVKFTMALATQYTNLYQVNQKTRASFLELAKACYLKVLSMDPSNVSANYNMGILYYNQAVYLIKGSDFDVDITSIDAIQDNQVQLFKQSLPLIEKAYELDPKREETLTALSGIYFGLNDFEKSKLYQEKLDQMKKNQQNKDK